MAVAALAETIWCQHFTPIIGAGQVAYMLQTIQSNEAIRSQIGQGYEYYLYRQGPLDIGYAALAPDPQHDAALQLSKLYLLQEYRGRGLGREMMNHLLDGCAQQGIRRLWLTVNRHNAGSIAFYRHLGFEITDTRITDIGGGYVMDDFIMERFV